MKQFRTASQLLLTFTGLVGTSATRFSGLALSSSKRNQHARPRNLLNTVPRGGAEGAFISPALVKEIGITSITYMTADFLSNFLQHPTQKMDYGIFNRLIKREVVNKWWGTRTEHIVGVAGCLAVTDHASQAIFKNIFEKTLSFANSPAAFVAHTFAFIFTGVALYVGADAVLNPNHAKGTRMAIFKEEVYNTYVGTNTAWFEPFVPGVLAMVVGSAAASGWLGSSLLPATLAYATVKGVGWKDWGNSGLTEHEVKLSS